MSSSPLSKSASGATAGRGAGPGTRILKGLLCSFGLLALLAGIPLSLSVTGDALPLAGIAHVVAHPGLMLHRLGSPVGDATISAIGSLVAWGAWAWLVACVVADLVARARGRTTQGIPGSRHMQALVTFMVSASIGLVALHGGNGAVRLHTRTPGIAQAGAPGGMPVVDLALTSWTSTTEPTEVPSAGRPAVPAPAPAPALYVVRPGDTLWSIAQQQLGSPLRWREIAALNIGRPQPGGLLMDAANWILPGWTLELPPPAAPAASTMPPPAAPAASSVGDLAALEVPPAASPEAPASPEARPPTHRAPESPVLPLAGVVLSTGVVAGLEMLRRKQARHRGEGRLIRLPVGKLARLEQRLRMGADTAAVDWIGLAQRLAASRSKAQGRRCPLIAAIRLSEHSVELGLHGGEELPPPFTPAGEGWWALERSERLAGELRDDPWLAGADYMAPTLVSVGVDSRGSILVDLESAGSLAVAGRQSMELMRAIAVELAASTWAEQVEVLLVGGGWDHVADLSDRMRKMASLADAAVCARRRVEEVEMLLAESGTTAVEARAAGQADAWDPLVVICAPEVADEDPEHLMELIALAGDGGRSLCLVCGADDPGARWRIGADGGGLSVEMCDAKPSELKLADARLGELRPQLMAEADVAGISELFAVARDVEGVTPDEPPYESIAGLASGAGMAGAGLASGEVSPPVAGEVQVCVLGPVEVRGASSAFSRAWALELVVYLAMHPGGAETSVWSAALWPDREPAASTLHSTASSARRALGQSSAGDDHLPRSHGRLRLGPGVCSDWAMLTALAGSGDPEAWRQALMLVRGRPFEGLRSSDWALFEGIQAMVEAGIVDLATRYAGHAIDCQDWPAAEWAARRGLAASPYDERLYRLLLRAADGAGNPAGVESVMSELLQLVAGDVEPFDGVHPETLELYRSLSRRPMAHAGRSTRAGRFMPAGHG